MHYHWGCSVSLPCSEWERVGPLRSDHQKLAGRRRWERLTASHTAFPVAGVLATRSSSGFFKALVAWSKAFLDLSKNGFPLRFSDICIQETQLCRRVLFFLM